MRKLVLEQLADRAHAAVARWSMSSTERLLTRRSLSRCG